MDPQNIGRNIEPKDLLLSKLKFKPNQLTQYFLFRLTMKHEMHFKIGVISFFSGVSVHNKVKAGTILDRYIANLRKAPNFSKTNGRPD